jgi:RHS repeat-associated protein
MIGGSAFVTMSDQHGDLAATFSPASTAAGLAGYATYSPYGAQSATGYKPNLGFQGDYTDPATGQVDMGARWYSPATGGFTTNDTIGGSPLSSTVDGNPYAYTSGSPLTATDPTGHCTLPVPVGGAIVLGQCPTTGTGTGTGTGIGMQWGSQGGTSSGDLRLGGWWQQFSQGQRQDTDPDWQIQMYEWALQRGYSPWTAPQTASGAGNSGCTADCGCTGDRGCTYSCVFPTPTPTPAPQPPPPPPPPPQDCYAGPDPTCVPTPAPASLGSDPLITQQASDITSFEQLLRQGRAIIQQPVRKPQRPVQGLQPSNTVNGSPQDNDGSPNIAALLLPLHDLHPFVPSSPTPGDGSNKTLRNLAKQVANAVAPVLQTVLTPVVNAAASALSNAVGCVTHPQLASYLLTVANVALFATGIGEEATITDTAGTAAEEPLALTAAPERLALTAAPERLALDAGPERLALPAG